MAKNKKNKRQYQKQPFESTGETSDVFAMIFASMLTSDAWNEATSAQHDLYIYCKLQYYREKTAVKEKLAEKYKLDPKPIFTMNRGKILEYKLCTPSNVSRVYKDLQRLEELGFIKKVVNGKTARTKNVFAFVSDWQKYKKEG
jgi:hypothetical protein